MITYVDYEKVSLRLRLLMSLSYEFPKSTYDLIMDLWPDVIFDSLEYHRCTKSLRSTIHNAREVGWNITGPTSLAGHGYVLSIEHWKIIDAAFGLHGGLAAHQGKSMVYAYLPGKVQPQALWEKIDGLVRDQMY